MSIVKDILQDPYGIFDGFEVDFGVDYIDEETQRWKLRLFIYRNPGTDDEEEALIETFEGEIPYLGISREMKEQSLWWMFDLSFGFPHLYSVLGDLVVESLVRVEVNKDSSTGDVEIVAVFQKAQELFLDIPSSVIEEKLS